MITIQKKSPSAFQRGGRRATFEVQDGLKNEERVPPVQPPPDKDHS